MKQLLLVPITFGFLVATSAVARGALSDGVYWADEVAGWAGDVQNYGGELMSEDTTWWLTGPPDADVDGNGCAWDPVDNDYVAGWRASGGASVTVYFEMPIWDGNGPDFMIYKYAGPNASASVWASVDDADYVQVGELAGGTPGYLEDVWIDLDGLVEDAHYIRVIREAGGPQTGTFIDALGAPLPLVNPASIDPAGLASPLGAEPVPPPPSPAPFPVPEPDTAVLIGLGCLAFAGRRGRSSPGTFANTIAAG